MAFAALLPILQPVIGPALDKLIGLIPDPQAAEKAKLEFVTTIMAAAQESDQQQVEINKAEAGHASLFVAGWRPFIGWICGFALAYHFIIQPFAAFAMAVAGVNVVLPQFDMGELMTILLGMLGLSVSRSYEKVQGVTTGRAGMPRFGVPAAPPKPKNPIYNN